MGDETAGDGLTAIVKRLKPSDTTAVVDAFIQMSEKPALLQLENVVIPNKALTEKVGHGAYDILLDFLSLQKDVFRRFGELCTFMFKDPTINEFEIKDVHYSASDESATLKLDLTAARVAGGALIYFNKVVQKPYALQAQKAEVIKLPQFPDHRWGVRNGWLCIEDGKRVGKLITAYVNARSHNQELILDMSKTHEVYSEVMDIFVDMALTEPNIKFRNPAGSIAGVLYNAGVLSSQLVYTTKTKKKDAVPVPVTT